MENHYHPELEEYILGLECKMETPLGIISGSFPDIFLLNPNLDEYKDMYSKAAHAIVWVKKLDKEDIESFGFTMTSDYGAGTSYVLEGIYQLQTVKRAGLTYPEGNVRIFELGLFKEPYDKIFDGVIKNKYELKRVLNQLQIIKT